MKEQQIKEQQIRKYQFEKQYRVKTIAGECADLEVEVPGSKSITNRALLLAALADGISRLKGALFSDDSRHFLQGLRELGFSVNAEEEAGRVTVEGLGGHLPRPEGRIYVGSAGTAARFLTAMLAFAGGRYELDASPQMKKRPMKPLLDALEGLGVRVEYLEQEGHFPFILESGKVSGGELSIDIGVSSQFLSALLMAGVMLPEGLRIHLTGERKSLPYVEMTARMMEQFGVYPYQDEKGIWCVPGYAREHASEPQPRTGGGAAVTPGYTARCYDIEPDVSGACYFYAMAVILGISVRVKGVHPESLQGDLRFLGVLEQLGCTVEDTPEGMRVTGPADGKYPGITVNMNEFSDQTMTMAAVAVFAQSPTKIEGVAHIRYQESNRIEAIHTELERLGIASEEHEDGLVIYPGAVRPAVIQTYDDHRMAMAFALIGLRTEGIIIDNPGCCSKTFEGYFALLDTLGNSK